ncbi:hypothetical protein LV779_29760 [Streptomyces thinghirensis]|nr:hypothetical protein [Streptomyces thinghirensis]
MTDTMSPRAATEGTWALPLLVLAPLALVRLLTEPLHAVARRFLGASRPVRRPDGGRVEHGAAPRDPHGRGMGHVSSGPRGVRLECDRPRPPVARELNDCAFFAEE